MGDIRSLAGDWGEKKNGGLWPEILGVSTARKNPPPDRWGEIF